MAWPEVVAAISTAVIALVLVVCSVGLLLLFGELRRSASELRRLAETVDRDARPALLSLRSLAEDAGGLVTTVRSEVDAIAETSQGLRKRVVSGADAIEERLRDLEALLDVVQDEVEDTVLDVAAALRTTRRGGRLFRKMKRAVLGRGR